MSKSSLSWLGMGILSVTIAAVTFSTMTDSKVVGAPLFTDVHDHWAKASIEAAVSRGYVNGFVDRTFKPNQKVSRAEFAKMVATALNLPVTGSTTGEDWYKPYVNATVAAGIHDWSDFPVETGIRL